MESTENTRSSRMIWKMAEPTLLMTTSFLSFSSRWSFDGVVSTAWWISFVAFQTRKRPPAIRIRSRQEKAVSKVSPWKPRSKTGAVRPTI